MVGETKPVFSKALKSFHAAFRMMKPSFWCPLNPLDRVSGPVRSHLLLQSFFFSSPSYLFSLKLICPLSCGSSHLLGRPWQTVIWFCSVHLSAPDPPLMQSGVEENFDAAPRPSVTPIRGGVPRQPQGLCGRGGTGPTLCSCFFTPFLVFDPFIFNHGTESTCRAPPSPR